jgi:hypothetical protein
MDLGCSIILSCRIRRPGGRERDPLRISLVGLIDSIQMFTRMCSDCGRNSTLEAVC